MKRFLAFFVAALMLCGITAVAEKTDDEFTPIQSELIYAWEMDTPWWQSWSSNGGMIGANGQIPVTGGHLTGTFSGTSNNWFIHNGGNVSNLFCDDIDYAEISVSSTNALDCIEFRLYAKDDDPQKIIKSDPIEAGGGQKIIRIENRDENGNPYTGATAALQVRFVPVNRVDTTIDIDYIRLYKTEETGTEQEIAFGIEMSNYKDWTDVPFLKESNSTTMHVGNDGILHAEYTGSETYAHSSYIFDKDNFSADSVDYIEVSMKAEKDLSNLIFYYLTNLNSTWSPYMTVSSGAIAASAEFKTVRIPIDRFNMQFAGAYFKGTVNNLRMDLKNTTGEDGNSVQIEYIRFCKDTLPNPAGSEYTRVHSFPIYAWEMDTPWWQSWSSNGGMIGANGQIPVTGGRLTGTFSGTSNNWFIHNGGNVSNLFCDDIDYAEISVSSTSALDCIEFRLYANGDDPQKIIKSDPIEAGGGQKIIRIENKDENGNPYTGATAALQVRFVPVNRVDTTIAINYIRLYKTENHGVSVKKTGNEIVYDFTVNEHNDGWKLNGENKYIRGGAVGASGTANETSYAETCAALDYDVTEPWNISITYQNASSTDTAKLYYKTVGDSDWSEEKSVEFAVKPNDDGFTTYTVYPQWSGTVTGLRFALLDGEGSFAIDKINLSKYSAVTALQWKNAAGETITELTPGAVIKATVTVERADPGSAEVFVALYGQDDYLIQTKYETLTFDEAGTQTTPDMAVTVPDTGSGYTAKVIVLDSMATLNPMRWRAAAANNRTLPIAQQ